MNFLFKKLLKKINKNKLNTFNNKYSYKNKENNKNKKIHF